jgi:hypothetical protein
LYPSCAWRDTLPTGAMGDQFSGRGRARYDNDWRDWPEILTEAKLIQLRDKDSNQLLGTIGDDDLRFLVDELEEESPTDQDYYFDSATVDMLEEDGAPASLVSLLRQVLGSKEGMEIRWERQ